MFEVLLGYITDIGDLLNYIIDAIQSLFSGKDEIKEPEVPSDEEKLQAASLFNWVKFILSQSSLLVDDWLFIFFRHSAHKNLKKLFNVTNFCALA